MNSQFESNDFDYQAEQQYRAGAYSLFAALFRAAPDRKTIEHLCDFDDGSQGATALEQSIANLGKSAKVCDLDELNDEYHALFIGLGRGQLLPYGSWYQTGFLMEKPLGELRLDLEQLGYQRNEGTREPEDHLAALCEVMSVLISEDIQSTQGHCSEQQRLFFEAHLSTWVLKFFDDLKNATSANFYLSVADFGVSFFDFEKEYFSMKV